jgi:class 3 adenylate cyclase
VTRHEAGRAWIVEAGVVAQLPPPDPAGDLPVSRRRAGAALVADVLGFTQLSRDLEAKFHGRGGDELARVMSAALDEAVALILSHGGLIVGLVGDAVQAIWLDDGAGRARCRVRAEAARQAILELSRPDGLVWRVGIAEGGVDIGLVGGVGGRWSTFVWGSALAQATPGAALADAPPEPVADCDPSPAGPGADPDILLPPALRGKSAAEVVAWMSELRVLSVVFCRLGPVRARVDFDDLHLRVRRTQAIALANGGAFEKVVADDKGIFAILVFGAPPDPVEGAAERAIATAIALSVEIPQASAGVATGKVYIGAVGRTSHAQYTLYGPAAILAARLMAAAAPGSALCDRATRDGAGLAGALAASAVDLKGLGALTAYALSQTAEFEASAPSESLAPAVVRERERAIVAEFVRAAGPRRLLLLCGDAGLGKGALAAAAILQARAAGRPVLQAAAPSYIDRQPLAAWRAPARALLRSRAAASGRSERQELDAIAQGLDPPADVAALANPLFRTRLQESAHFSVMPAEERAQSARQTQARILSELAGRNALLVLLQADRMDEASLALADSMAALNPEIRVVCAVRDRTSRAAQWLADRFEARCETLALAPLDRPATAALIQTARPVDADHPLVDWVHERSRGNPRLALELLRALPRDILDRALVSRGAWREALPELQLADMPTTIEAAIMDRVARETPGGQTVLKAASVLGRRFDAAELAELGLPIGLDAIEAALRQLAHTGLLAPQDGRYDFQQSLVRDALHAALPAELRRGLHLRAARSMERRKLFERAADLARHWRDAGRPQAAFRYARRAGRQAMAAGAHRDAADFFRESLQCDGAAEANGAVRRLRRARLHALLAECLANVSEFDGAMAAGRNALQPFAMLPPAGDSGWPAYALKTLAALAGALAVPRRRPPTRRQRYEAEIQSRTAFRLSDLVFFRYGLIASCAMSARSAWAAEKAGNRAGASRAYAILGYTAGVLRIPLVPRFLLRRPLADALAKRDWSALHFVRGSDAWLSMSLGRIEPARRLMRRLEPYRTRTKGDLGQRTHLAIVSQLEFHRGDMAAALRAIDEMARLAAVAGDDRHQAWGEMGAGRIALTRGQDEAAAERFARARQLYARARDEQGAMHISALLAFALARMGRFEEVEREADAVVANVSNPLGWMSYTWDGPAAAAEAMMRLQQWRPGVKSASRVAGALLAAARYARLFPLGRPGYAYQRGGNEMLRGRLRRAARCWRKGAAEAQRMGLALDEYGCLLRLASCEAIAAAERARCGERAAKLGALLNLPQR